MTNGHWTDPRDAEIARLEAIVAEMEAEIELACGTACDLCRPDSELAELVRLADASGVSEWYHGNERWVCPEECEASDIRERRYQRRLKGSK